MEKSRHFGLTSELTCRIPIWVGFVIDPGLCFPAGLQVQTGAMHLSLYAENPSSWVVVWLQVHGGDVTCLSIESEERIGRKREFILMREFIKCNYIALSKMHNSIKLL